MTTADLASRARDRRPSRARLTVPLLLALVVACRGPTVRTHAEADFALEAGATYAWTSSTPGALLDDPDARRRWGEFRAAVDDALAGRGATRVADVADATLLVDLDLAIDTVVHHHDPYFNLYVAERAEEADLTVSLRDAATRQVVWRGECRNRLRYLERAMGGHVLKWYPVEAERDWRVDELVTRVFERIPGARTAGEG